MLVTDQEIQDYLGSSYDAAYDDFLDQQNQVISDAVETYCGRVFSEGDWIQTFYADDFQSGTKELKLFHYPVSEVTAITAGTLDISDDIRLHKPTGTIVNATTGFFLNNDELTVEYTAGYAEIPSVIKSVVLEIISEEYNKKLSGVPLSFGNNVQRISIPGTISVDFDYSLQSNDRSTPLGTLLGSHVNVLDAYRSERVVVGSGKLSYVEVNP